MNAIPPGTRDVLPDEMRELRAISARMRSTFEHAGYGEVHTPALEYEEVLRRGEEHAAGARYRTFDEQGDVLALRSDMTIPIARVVGKPLPGGRDATSLLLLLPRLARGRARSGRAARVPAGRARADRDRGARRRGRGAGADLEAPGRGGPATPPHRGGGRFALSHAADFARGARGRGTAAARGAVARATWSASRCESRRSRGSRRRTATLLVRLPELRGGREVLERATARLRRGRRPARAARAARASAGSPTG